MSDIENIELANLDGDIEVAFSECGTGCYKIGLPTQIQLVRLIRVLIQELKKSNDNPGNSCNG